MKITEKIDGYLNEAKPNVVVKSAKIEVSVQHKPEHFNKVCKVTIPEVWEVACVNLAELLAPVGKILNILVL